MHCVGAGISGYGMKSAMMQLSFSVQCLYSWRLIPKYQTSNTLILEDSLEGREEMLSSSPLPRSSRLTKHFPRAKRSKAQAAMRAFRVHQTTKPSITAIQPTSTVSAMAQIPCLYRESRLTPSPTSASHILDIDASNPTTRSASLARAGSKRPFEEISSHDEDSYARKYLATEGSVFFRAKHRSPRSLLWRVLDDRKVLEIQSVDLVKEKKHDNADSWLTYRVHFGNRILEKGVQFADPEGSDALECYVLTEGKELVTTRLGKDLLLRPDVPAHFDPGNVAKRYTSSVLSVRNPYRFLAVSSLLLLVSLADGGLVRLERKAGENGTQWRETFFSEGGWRDTLTLKGLNPFAGRPVVRYGTLELDPSAVADMAMSPDGKFVWTVSLDHCLRAWSTASGKVVLKQDLLNERLNERERNAYAMSAEQGRLLQIVQTGPASHDRAVTRMDEDGKYALVVHSPKDHQIKIYEITNVAAVEGETVQLLDLQPDFKLIPPTDEFLNANIWHLDTFHMQRGANWAGVKLWVRARSGALCRTFVIDFDVLDDGEACDLRDVWRMSWTVVDAGASTAEELKNSADFPGELEGSGATAVTPSEQWLAFLFYPGRFTSSSLETALYMYRKARGLGGSSSARGFKAAERPLEERLLSAITAKILLRRSANDQPDYQRYQQDIQAQWRNFWSVLSLLHTRRQEAVGFSFDTFGELPWSIGADYVAPLRICSSLELRQRNSYLLYDNLDAQVDEVVFRRIFPARNNGGAERGHFEEPVAIGRLMDAARQLRLSFSAAANGKIRDVAYRNIKGLRDEGERAGLPMALYEEVDMQEEVTTEAFDALNEGVEVLDGLTNLENEHFQTLLGWLEEAAAFGGVGENHRLARYGVAFTVQAAQVMLQEAEGILLDVLTLVAFMAGDIDEPLSDNFNADHVYLSALRRLQGIQLLLWLAQHEREKTMQIGTSPQVAELMTTETLLEDIYIGNWLAWEPRTGEQLHLPEILTLSASAWINGPQLGEYYWEGATTDILARLVKLKETALATEFLTFTAKQLPWSQYVQARLYLLKGAYTQASALFISAAQGVSKGEVRNDAELLSPHEEASFGSGLVAYYQHIISLFEKLKAYSYVVDFAHKALNNTQKVPNFTQKMAEIDRKKNATDSPAFDRFNASADELKLLKKMELHDEILNRLFIALLATARYREAFDALTDIENRPVKRSCLHKLIEAAVKSDCVSDFLALPFSADLASAADTLLADSARRELASGSFTTSTPYYQILYAFRVSRSDFRGAASILYEHLVRLKAVPEHVRDPEDETVVHCYLLLINTLACCGEDEAWILAEPKEGTGEKRGLVRLSDLRREYVADLDRRSEVVLGRFPLVGGDGGGEAMDVL